MRSLRADQRGSVAIWVGIALTVFIGCAGIAVDTARGYMLKARLSQALDAAALAGAKALGSNNVESDITMFFNANFPAASLDATLDGPHITTNTTTNTITVDAKATTDSTLMAVLGFKTITVGASATAVRGLNGLDVVIAIDMSGSMCQPCTKIEAAETAAKTLIDTLYSDPNPKSVTINGVNWDLLNIGMVPWNAKVNVKYNKAYSNATYDPVNHPTDLTELTVNPTYTYPWSGEAGQSKIYLTNVSPVRLFKAPPANWSGAVYARYIDDYRAAKNGPPKVAAVPNDESNDADLKLGYGKFGGKDWIAFEPVDPLEGEPVDKSVGPPFTDKWTNITGGDYGSTTWTGTYRNCYQNYWNDTLTDVQNMPAALRPPNPDHTAQSWWVIGNPSQGSGSGTEDCTKTLTHGILPLYPVKDTASKKLVTDAIDGLYAPPGSVPDGNTDAPQGLFWAWEVLMPGEPFDQAKASTPFTRTQAIVFLTDGEITGQNGDAYKGVFGPDTGAGTTNKHGLLATGVDNNLNNRLKKLAANIKGADPAKGVKIYVVQYDVNSDALKSLLQSVATEPNAPYYYDAKDSAALQTAFKKIAASLSVLRLAK